MRTTRGYRVVVYADQRLRSSRLYSALIRFACFAS